MTNNLQTPGGNTTTAGAVEPLRMARRIADRWGIGSTEWIAARDAALAAIIETREACARLADSLEPSGDLADEAEFFLGACSHGEKIAAAIRNSDHLKGQP